jgi:hypothetical protein
MEANPHDIALGVMAHFARLAENGGEVWLKGLETAKHWLRLIDTDERSQADLEQLLGIAHANRYRSSAWMSLASYIHEWVGEKGLAVPIYEDFFDGKTYYSDRRSESASDMVKYYLTIFELRVRQEPNYDPWRMGLEAAQEWQQLLSMPQVTRELAANLLQMVDHYGRSIDWSWFELALAIYNWCNELGYLDLVPRDRRSFLKNPDH